MAGLASAKLAPQPLPAGALLCGAFVLAVAAVILAPRHRGCLPVLVTGVFLSGAASYEINRSHMSVYDMLPAREARLTLRITHIFPENNQAEQPSRPNARPAAHAQEASGLARITGAEPHLRELVGQRVYFSVSLPPGSALAVPENTPSQIIRTAEISVIGMLAPLPRRVATDSFDGYLASSGMNFKLAHGRLLALEKTPSGMAAFYERARLRFSKILSTGLERRPKQTGTLRAMVLGQKQDIDEQQNTLFLGSGTMHLFAISGLHIATIATGIQALLLFLRLPPWFRLAVGTLVLYIYVQITGASPSAMRAFVMVTLLQASRRMRLPVNGIATLAFAALVTLLAAPMQLFSASFQMSYGIVAALLLYGLPLGEGWLARRVPFREVPPDARTRFQRFFIVTHHYLLSVLGIGIAASLVSAICGTIYFKLFTPGSLLANLLLIPAAVLVIFAGFLSLLFGLAGLAPLSVFCNHSAALLLLVMEESLQFFLKIPGVSMPAHFSPVWLGYGAFALLLASMLYGYAKKWTLRRGGFWTPVAVVVVALVLCASHG
jgi:competence protein ComEC